MIVNNAISGHHFPRRILGLGLGQMAFLLTLCGLFLLCVLVNGAFKYGINVLKGRTGEGLLLRLRCGLYDNLLRFPLPRFRHVAPGEVVAMISGETEPMGYFFSEAFAQPLLQGCTLTVSLAFIFVQDLKLGAAAISLYPLQAWLIPRLQAKVNALDRQRILNQRQLANEIGETVAGAAEIHANDGAVWHLTQNAVRLGTSYALRYAIFRLSFFIDFLNAFINQLTPFLFFTVGGVLAIHGSLSMGALVGVLAAYKDLPGPWRELLDWYQQKEDMRIKFDQVVTQFHPPGLTPVPAPGDAADTDARLSGPIRLDAVTYADPDSAVPVIAGATACWDFGRSIAVTGGTGAGCAELALLLTGLAQPDSGRIRLGARDLAAVPRAQAGRRIGHVGPDPRLIGGSLRDNLLYGLRQRPRVWPAPVAARWRGLPVRPEIAAAADGEAALEPLLRAVLGDVGLEEDVFGFGLTSAADPARLPDLAPAVLRARAAFAGRLPAPSRLIEPFDPGRYLARASILGNILFGDPVGPALAPHGLSMPAPVAPVLTACGLDDILAGVGLRIATTLIEIFGSLQARLAQSAGFDPGDEAEAERLEALARRPDRRPGKADATRLRALALQLVRARDRLGLIDDALAARILDARAAFARLVPGGIVDHYHPERYAAGSPIRDNILFGRAAAGPGTGARLDRLIAEVVDEAGLRAIIVSAGLDHDVGVGGARLTPVQRRQVALARALVKDVDLLVVDNALAGMGAALEHRIRAAVLQRLRDRGVIWLVDDTGDDDSYDEVWRLDGGRLTRTA